MSHLLGIVKMDGNLPAQKAAAEQIAQAVRYGMFPHRSIFRFPFVVLLRGVLATHIVSALWFR